MEFTNRRAAISAASLAIMVVGCVDVPRRDAADAERDSSSIDALIVDDSSTAADAQRVTDATVTDATVTDATLVADVQAGCRANDTPERCNGLDDDCDQSVDEGCPTGVRVQAPTRLGSAAPSNVARNLESAAADEASRLIRCPEGHVLRGFSAALGSGRDVIAPVRLLCAPVRL